jgi:hypothetical protein
MLKVDLLNIVKKLGLAQGHLGYYTREIQAHEEYLGLPRVSIKALDPQFKQDAFTLKLVCIELGNSPINKIHGSIQREEKFV